MFVSVCQAISVIGLCLLVNKFLGDLIHLSSYTTKHNELADNAALIVVEEPVLCCVEEQCWIWIIVYLREKELIISNLTFISETERDFFPCTYFTL